MESDFGLREAVIDDAREIARVNYSTWHHTYHGLIPDSELDSLNLELLTDSWKQNLSLLNPRINTYVVLVSELLVAYSRIYPSADPDDNPDRVATIGSMYVDPKFQRRGIGRALMESVLKYAEGHDFAEVTLHVLEANESARNFYEHLGWEKDSVADMDGFLEERVPRVRYRRKLSGC
jgi:ribosomal protein S18 acetylase RimI-like enzyme